METRKIEITIDQAIEWYNSSNEALRTLASTVFSKAELKELELTKIKEELRDPTYTDSITVLISDHEKLKVAEKLYMLANYHNKGWKKRVDNRGFFLSLIKSGEHILPANIVRRVEGIGDIIVSVSSSSICPNLIYFRREEDLMEAAKILGGELDKLFT